MTAVNGANGVASDSEIHRRLAALEAKWAADVEKGNVQAVSPDGEMGDKLGLAAAVNRIALSVQLQGNQYRVANPSPLGLLGFGYTTFILQGYNTKWTEEGTDFWAYSYALAFGGLVQLLAGQWDLYRNNVFGGTAFSSYGGFWIGYGIFGILASNGTYMSPETYTKGSQMALALWGLLTFGLFLASLLINIALMTLFLALTITFFLLAAGQTGHPNCVKAGGYFGVFTAAVAWYIAFAELINSVYGRTLLPLGVVNLLNKEPSMTGVDRPNTL